MDLNAELINLLDRFIVNKNTWNLIELGANPNVISNSGYTLLHILIFNKQVKNALYLINHYGANPNIKDHKGVPPLYYMLNKNYETLEIIQFIEAGAIPLVQNKSGNSAIHFLIKTNFNQALALIKIHPESVHLKNAHGYTPLQMMLNMREDHLFSADDYLNMVRLGADPDTRDNEDISLLCVINSANSLSKSRELIALSKITAKQRIHYIPELLDYFLDENGIINLMEALMTEKHSAREIGLLARYPFAKEMLLKNIKNLKSESLRTTLDACLRKGTHLNLFFSAPRGWFMTKPNRGTLACINEMRQNIINLDISHPINRSTPQQA